MHVDLRESLDELRRLARREKSAKQLRRLRIIILATQGSTAEDIIRTSLKNRVVAIGCVHHLFSNRPDACTWMLAAVV